MDKEELILRKLEKIQLNNEIVQLEETNKKLSTKSKVMLAELIKSNAILTHEKSALENKVNALLTENNNLQNIINKVPKFILRIFAKKNIKLLNKGNMHE